jgi:hypothetical protein
MNVSLQRDLSIAVAEFAPTSKIVANKKLWTSYGLKKVAEKEWTKRHYRRCVHHNLFERWDIGQSPPGERCCDHLVQGKYIVPLFGFVSNLDPPKEPTSRPARVFTTRPYFAGLSIANPDTFSFPQTGNPIISLTKSSPGEMVVLCEGKTGAGFYICRLCGAGFRTKKIPHEGPLGTKCSGQLEQVSLGHEFVTDVIKLQFLVPPGNEITPVWLAYGLAYAIVEGSAEILEIPSSDLNATIAFTGERGILPPIILYDNVPGGAGLVSRLEQEATFWASLQSACKRVSGNCGCEDNTSCYGCLRSFKNQFAHQHLRRGAVKNYLERILSDYSGTGNTSGSF